MDRIASEHCVDLKPYLGSHDAVSCLSLAHDGQFYVGVELGAVANGAFAHGRGLRILAFCDDTITLDTKVKPQASDGYTIWPHFLQPLGADQLLIVNARQTHKDASNAMSFTLDGDFVRDYHLGDAIEDVQTTASGHIWVSYFDEQFSRETHLAEGLVAIDRDARILYKFEGGMFDCYALNVIRDGEAWCYNYFSDQLIRVRDEQASGSWTLPFRGVLQIAVQRCYVLVDGGYNHRHEFVLLEFREHGVMRELRRFQIEDGDDDIVDDLPVWARHDSLYFMTRDRAIRRLSIASVLSA